MLVGALVAGGLRYAYWDKIERRFQTIHAGILYKSGAMSPDLVLDKVRAHHIRTVVDLKIPGLETSSGPEQAALVGAGVRYINLPTDQIPELATVEAFLDVMADPANHPVLVHCHHGYGRSVLFSALYRIEFEGWDNERARRATRLFSFRGSFGPGSPAGEYLRAYTPRRRD